VFVVERMEIEDRMSRSKDLLFRVVFVVFGWCWGVTVFKKPGDNPTETSGRQDECTRQFWEAWSENRKSQSGERVIIKRMMCRGMMQEAVHFSEPKCSPTGRGLVFKCAAAQIVA
jgi:hypothetical protein